METTTLARDNEACAAYYEGLAACPWISTTARWNFLYHAGLHREYAKEIRAGKA